MSVYRLLDRGVVGRLLPPRCVSCNRPGAERGHDLCVRCHADLPRIDHPCPRCGLPTARNTHPDRAVVTAGAGCAHCHGQLPGYATCFAPYAYRPPLARLIQALKYEGALANGRVLGTLLARASRCRGPAGASPAHDDLVVPLPLHVDRLVERGYNQSYEIARFAAAELGLPCRPEILQRVRRTPPQVGLPREQRLANVHGAFCARPGDVAGRSIVLLDDVITTGSTIAAAAVALKEAGAARVEAWAVARALG